MNAAIEMSINNFAGIVSKGFAGVDKQFSELRLEIDERFNKVDQKFLDFKTEIVDEMNGRFLRVDRQFVDLKVELKDEMNGRFAKVDQRFDRLEGRFDKLEKLIIGRNQNMVV